jgi:streptogramin lyase
MAEFLNRKYAILQQQADAGTTQADATTKNASSTALLAQAGARLDNTRADVMPAESAAMIAQRQAETALTGEQGRWYGSEATARIGNLNANTGYTMTQDQVAQREGLHDWGEDGRTRFSQYRLPNSAPRPRAVVVPPPLRIGQSLLGSAPSMRSANPNIIDFSNAPAEGPAPANSTPLRLRVLNAYDTRDLR